MAGDGERGLRATAFLLRTILSHFDVSLCFLIPPHIFLIPNSAFFLKRTLALSPPPLFLWGLGNWRSPPLWFLHVATSPFPERRAVLVQRSSGIAFFCMAPTFSIPFLAQEGVVKVSLRRGAGSFYNLLDVLHDATG